MSDTYGAEPTAADLGFTADEQAAFEAMKNADRGTDDGSGGGGGGDPPADGDAGAGGAGDTAAGTADPPAAAADGDADDEGEDDAAAVAGDDTAKPPPKRVSFGKFRRIDDARKAAEAELATERKARAEAMAVQARLDERLRIINEALTTPPAPPAPPVDEDPEPDQETDIFAHGQWLKREMARRDERNQRQIQELLQTRQVETAETQMADRYLEDAASFAQREPNFIPAYDHLMRTRLAQIAMGEFDVDVFDPNATLTPEQVVRIRQIAAGEEKALVANALKNKKSPADVIFRMARATGFQPQAAAAAAGGAPPAGGAGAGAGTKPASGAPAGGAAPSGGQPSVSAEIARLKAGQDAALSLSGGGGSPGIPLNARALADMSDDKFNAMLETMSKAQLQALMGG